MPYKDLVRLWHEGIVAAEKKDYDLALKSFSFIEDPPAKIWFNVGCIHLLRGDFPQALEAYDKSVIQDPCLAVGYFQRGYINFKLGRYEKVQSDCHLAITNLRNNSFIDYKQLGLRHVLFSWEVQYNMAAVLCYLGKWESAEEKLKKTLQGDGKNTKLDSALHQVQRRILLPPIHVPMGEFFRPRKQEVEQLNSVDFLGTPKIISSVVPNDQYSGFEPLRPQQPGFYEPCRDAMQGREAGYHRVVVHYYPENSNEVAVKANSVLFVLNKDGDWATAIHDGQKILIPTSFLEPTNPPKADIKKMNNGIPLPPMKTPPTRPNVKPGVEQITLTQQGTSVPPPVPDFTPPQPTGDAPEPYTLNVLTMRMEPILEVAMPLQRSAPTHKDMAALNVVPKAMSPPAEDDKLVLHVHTEFTVNMTVSKAMAYPELQEVLRDKLKKHGELMANHLSYKDLESKGLTLVKDNKDWQEMLKLSKDKQLTLCCKDPNLCVGRPILYRMKAQYDYQAEGPADLSFQQGDVISILSEVNQEWLEGHCNGNIGIFPKCFAKREDDM
ncbi:NADPH oxidase activator 1 [Xenopus laevis]|uniref:NADPH oxidase activator 1 n=2 Tax=Xenopus laevis TaxID=8355 RepID=A0A1L8F5R6_XENLA|nr:NADPH oxidase activator 1 [Xenopus laevis]OCT66931.1 hypothetical protein XELAEV_18038213mg [Xenopus laevis]